MDSRDVIQLLVEIRDLQREHLAEFRRVTQESLELSRRAVRRQEQFGRLYRLALVAAALVLVALGLFLVWFSGLLR